MKVINVRTIMDKIYKEKSSIKNFDFDNYYIGYNNGLSMVQSMILTMLMSYPTLNIFEVVRCMDCKYWDERKTNSNEFMICPVSGMEIYETDFCSYGERKK